MVNPIFGKVSSGSLSNPSIYGISLFKQGIFYERERKTQKWDNAMGWCMENDVEETHL